MTAPAQITVVGAFTTGATGRAATGTVTFTPSVGSLFDPRTSTNTPLVPVVANLDAGGNISAQLYVVDDLFNTPDNWSWTVTESINGQPSVTYPITPEGRGALPTTQQLISLASGNVAYQRIGYSLGTAVVPGTGGSGSRPARAVTASGNVNPNDGILDVSTPGGSVTLTLPAAGAYGSEYFTIKRASGDNPANTVQVASSGGALFDGNAGPLLVLPGNAYDLWPDGTNWKIS